MNSSQNSNDSTETIEYQYSGNILKALRTGNVNDGILSENVINSFLNSKPERIRIKMVDGKKYKDNQAGPFIGWNWKGKFAAQLVDDKGDIISELDLNKAF